MITFSQLGNHGEFGNNLFQIAATIGYATKINDEYLFPLWKGLISGKEYSKYFKTPIPEGIIKDNLVVYKEPNFHYDSIVVYPTIPKLSKKMNIDLFGYFQSEKYFEHCKDQIKKFFIPNDLTKNIKLLNYKNSVCLQLRFYDNKRSYTTSGLDLDPENNSIFYQPEENIPFLKKALNYFGYKKNYFVITNNMYKAKSMFGDYDNFYFLDNFNYIEQFFIQTMCEHNIISNSSFGWWGAWLNDNPDKVIFAPKQWFKDDKITKDLYPKEWKIL